MIPGKGTVIKVQLGNAKNGVDRSAGKKEK
jgi:hypothetical protein